MSFHIIHKVKGKENIITHNNNNSVYFQVSYDQVCWPIAETQLVLMQREALKIVSGSNVSI